MMECDRGQPQPQHPWFDRRPAEDIYTGKLTNWNQVGGPNLLITPYSRRLEEGGTIEFLPKTSWGENLVPMFSSSPQQLKP